MAIRIKRVYDPVEEADGLRVLVDRIWPRGISKDAARLDSWARSISPSDELRRWYGHDPDKWNVFRERYFDELDKKFEDVEQLIEILNGREVTFVYSAKSALNNALALKDYLVARHPELV